MESLNFIDFTWYLRYLLNIILAWLDIDLALLLQLRYLLLSGCNESFRLGHSGVFESQPCRCFRDVDVVSISEANPSFHASGRLNRDGLTHWIDQVNVKIVNTFKSVNHVVFLKLQWDMNYIRNWVPIKLFTYSQNEITDNCVKLKNQLRVPCWASPRLQDDGGVSSSPGDRTEVLLYQILVSQPCLIKTEDSWCLKNRKLSKFHNLNRIQV